MAVLAHLRIPAGTFELGQILDMTEGASIKLETLVPLGEKAVPFFSVHGTVASTFEANVRAHDSVTSITAVSEHDDSILYALDWEVGADSFFRSIAETGATILSATGGPDTWAFELRFPTYETLEAFREHCSARNVLVEIDRIYNPSRPESGPFYGLTQPQREALVRAVEGGYYSIPRRVSTKDLAEEFGISDQAVTERLRRAILTLVDNSLVAAMEAESEPEE
ncbi:MULTISPECIES: helix-turn-helix domain-containing protein [Haloarcula]|uniref:helix-turn-helix domain-containing protein n=1 Tax=Haloarcula TaxID=2237 RepID=UPI0023E87B07|nr:helix-turn-helix domain-containing protein [Halomicroarcula sp. SHR3]